MYGYLSLLKEFINDISEYSSGIKTFPHETDRFIYDPKYSPDWLRHYLIHQHDDEYKKDDMNWGIMDGDCCYQWILCEVNDAQESGHLIHICNSKDIGEKNNTIEYSYYYGEVLQDIQFLFHMSDHYMEYSSRLTVFCEKISFEIRADNIYVDIWETVESVKNIFAMYNGPTKTNDIKKFLQTTDRVEFNFANNWNKKRRKRHVRK